MRLNKTQIRLFLKFLKYLLPYRKKLFLILLLGGACVLLGLVIPYLSKLVVDTAILEKDFKVFMVLGVIGTCVFILNGLLSAMADLLKRGLLLKVKFDLNKRLFEHFQELPIGFFQDKSTGEFMFKISHDIDGAVDFIVNIPEEFVKTIPKLFLILGILFYLDWLMALFALVLVPILYVPVYFLTQRMRRILEILFDDSENIFKRMEEMFSHMYLVKAFGKEKQETRNYLRILIANLRIRLKNIRLEVLNSFAGEAFKRVVVGMITLFGGYLVIKGKMSTGTLVAVMLYMAQLVGLQSSLGIFFQRIVFGLVSCQRIDGIFQEKSKFQVIPGMEDKKKITIDHPQIEFKRISFGYKPGEYILKNIDFKIDNGFIALTGPSGCGKTTLINLILKLHEPWEGTILFDGYDSAGLDYSLLRKQIGVALQDPFLWNDTIENNIRYGRENASHEEIIESARVACVNKFVQSFPQGYATIIGENACKLSEGQKQKIAIARAWIKKPKILILDEAMSAMDSASEERILLNMKKNQSSADVAWIVVSHRLSTVKNADLVYFLSRSDTMILDSPANLLEKNREFAELFAGQV
ncbi:MAG: ABC transporter ATP-binding protein/permease [Candidatus Aminicenantes bacterium]|nr:ABC transporter ATP-binding protein/permease [Candidatus Aminicenantes bacterium]